MIRCVVGNTVFWGAVQTSSDSLYASVACYNGSAGSAAPSGSDRLGISLKASGEIVTTRITTTLSARTPYSALVVDGKLYMGTSSGVLAMANLGATAAASVSNIINGVTTNPIYNIQDVNGKLYISTFGTTTPFLVASVDGTGIPTTADQTATSLFTASAVTPSLAGSSPNGIYVWNDTEVYGTGASNIWKATYDGTSWTAITLAVATPANGITVSEFDSVRYVFFTRESGLYRTIDSGSSFSSAVLVRSVTSGRARYHDITTVPNACVDTELNLDETDTDCGGNTCATCSNGKQCLSGSDCTSTYCNAGGVCGEYLW